HRVLEISQLGRQRRQRPRALHHLLERRLSRDLAHVLAEVADADAAIDRHGALIGRLLLDDVAKERGLARAVGPDQANLLAPVDGCGGAHEENLPPVLRADVVESNHPRTPRMRVAPLPMADAPREPKRAPRGPARARPARARATGRGGLA